MKLWEKFTQDSTFKPIEMFPEWMESINKDFPIWNFSEEHFHKEINVFIFIVSSLSKWCNDDIIKKFYDYFWWKIILDAFEIHKNQVSENYKDYIKNLVDNFLEK